MSIVKFWRIEAALFRVAPYFSIGALALLVLSGAWYSLSKYFERERSAMCLAENLYHEVRGERLADIYRVGMLTLARVADPDPQWPKTICGVVAQDRQYSWVLEHKLATSRSERERWEESKEVARDLLQNAWVKYRLPAGWECARFYKRTDGKGVSRKAERFFSSKLQPVGTFGSHTAFREKVGCKKPLPTA